MKTFFNILQTLVGIINKSYPGEEFKIPATFESSDFDAEKLYISFLIGTMYWRMKQCNKPNGFAKNAFHKFKSLNSIYENNFYENEFKERISNIFINSQKHYYAFTRLARIYKLKKYPYVVTDDLSLNPLQAEHKLTFILIENKSNYLFNIHELVTIIENAICNSPNFFSEPLWPLNPYNNQPLNISTLYNIYFQLKKTLRIMPILFHGFFLENFNMNNFAEHYEPLIREDAIRKYIFNSPHTMLYSSVISMLKHNIYTNKYEIHKDFPKELLVDIFRPFLFYDYIANYYIKGTSKVHNARTILFNKLKQFYNYNKTFGRQIIKLTRKNTKIVKKEYTFNTKYLPFNNIDVSSESNTNNLIFVGNNFLTVEQYLYNMDNSQSSDNEDDNYTENENENNNNDNTNNNIIANNADDADNDSDYDIYEEDSVS